MSLTDLLTSNAQDTLSDDQGRWRQFVLDHLDYIAARSTTYNISEEVIYAFRYDLKRFLKDHLPIKRNEDIAWVVLLLNDMHNDFEFVNAGSYVVPSDKLMLDLYHSYRTINGNSF